MIKRLMGKNGPEVSAIGLGCMGLSEFYGQTDADEARKTVQKALEHGITYLDTADCYGNGANEELISSVLKEWSGDVFIATKFGIVREPGVYERKICGRPEYVKKAVQSSLKRLGVDVIDLYYYHRIDKDVPIEDTVGAMSDLVKEGKVKYLGLSEVAPDTIKRANSIHKITAIQSEYSLMTRAVENSVIPVLNSIGTGFVAYSPLCRGLLSGKLDEAILNQKGDMRMQLSPRMCKENLVYNRELVNVLYDIASQKKVTVAQLSLAWVLAKGENIIPIPGTKRINYLLENISAVNINLNTNEIAAIEAAIPPEKVRGNRYTEAGLVGLESY